MVNVILVVYLYLTGLKMSVNPNIKTYVISSKLEEGFRVVSNIRDHVVVQDLPEAVGGKNEGPLPTELLLASYAGCIGIVARFHAHRFNIDIRNMEIRVEGDCDIRGFMGENVKPGFREIRAKIIVDAPKASEEKIRQFIEFVEEHCPIGDTIASQTPIKVEITKK